MLDSTALRLTGRDVLSLLHRTTSNALADLISGGARPTLFCDYRGRLQHRALVTVTKDGAVWLLRPDATGDELAAAVERTVFRDDVRIEDRSAEFSVVLAASEPGAHGLLAEHDGIPFAAAAGDGTLLALDGREPWSETERITRLRPRHGHEVVEAFNPFEVGLAHEVHLAKGCFTGQEALQRLVTYDSVRRRPAHVRLGAEGSALPCDILARGERIGVLTSRAGRDGFAVLRREAVADPSGWALEDGTAVEIVEAPEPSRPLGRP